MVFVGGATIGLLVTDPASPKSRPTDDVDVVVAVTSIADYQLSVVDRLRALGFEECSDPDAPICAWVIDGLRVDVMPSDERILGFSNRWYHEVLRSANLVDLDGHALNVISPPCFLATKFVAFEGRGRGDYYASQDLEDIVVVLEGRPEIVEEVRAAPSELRSYIAKSASNLMGSRDFLNALPGQVEEGRTQVVLERLSGLTAL